MTDAERIEQLEGLVAELREVVIRLSYQRQDHLQVIAQADRLVEASDQAISCLVEELDRHADFVEQAQRWLFEIEQRCTGRVVSFQQIDQQMLGYLLAFEAQPVIRKIKKREMHGADENG